MAAQKAARNALTCTYFMSFIHTHTHTDTDADTGNGFVLYQTDAHAAGRQKDRQRDRVAGSIALAAEKGAKEKRRGT